MQKDTITFREWPQESIERFAEILAEVLARKINTKTEQRHDAEYLASLPSDERAAILRKKFQEAKCTTKELKG